MPLIERDIAINALPTLSEFRPVMLEGWKEWLRQPPKFRSKMTSSARASIVHDLMVDAAARRFVDHAKLIDKSGLKLFVFNDFICVRIKKHDEELLSKNQPTLQVRNFLGQQQIEGVPSIYNLEMGYILDASQTEIIATNLICPNGYRNRPYWCVELKDEGYLYNVTDIFDPAYSSEGEERTESGARWKTRESGVVIPFKRILKSDD